MRINVGFKTGTKKKLQEAVKAKVTTDRKGLVKAILKSAFAIEKGAKEDAPSLTGRLRASIHVKTKDSGSHSYQDSEGNSYTARLSETISSDLEAIVGTDVDYASYQENRKSFLEKNALQERGNLLSNLKAVINK